MLDLIVEGARIFDGVSPVPIATDLAVVGERIALIGDLGQRESVRRVQGGGLTLAPGFIDVHSHSDELWLVEPLCRSKIMQGVTTEIGGNCGSSVAPLLLDALERKRTDAAAYGLDVEWTDLEGFFAQVESAGIALNVATLVGLGTTRRCVRGDREGRLASEELVAQTALVESSVEQGALGVSSGLIYTPSRYADSAELTACAQAARRAGAGRYVSHLRSEGDRLLEAVDEALAVGRAAEVAVQLSHHKAAGKRNWGKVHRSLEAIERARREGLAVATDVYPYVASWTGLDTILPDDVALGGRAATLTRLQDPANAALLAVRLELERGGSWHDILVSEVHSERNADLCGLRIDEIARRWRMHPARAAIELLLQEQLEVEAIFFSMSEEDVATVLSAGFACVGSDASARAISGITAKGSPHPRTFGCFPRVFGRFVRQRRTLDVGEAIRRMTALPAELFGLRDRGRIAQGAYADLVLFDAERIVDTATYERPFSYPEGIAGVWVNGTAVVRDGAATGARPGRVLRHGR